MKMCSGDWDDADRPDGAWDCECIIRGRVTVPPPTAGTVSYPGGSVAESKKLPTSDMESSQFVSSMEPAGLGLSLDSSARSAKPLVRANRRL